MKIILTATDFEVLNKYLVDVAKLMPGLGLPIPQTVKAPLKVTPEGIERSIASTFDPHYIGAHAGSSKTVVFIDIDPKTFEAFFSVTTAELGAIAEIAQFMAPVMALAQRLFTGVQDKAKAFMSLVTLK